MTSQLQAVRRKPEAYPWVTSLLAKKPNKLVAVAMANKAARIAWVVLLISHHTVKSPLVMPLSFFAAVGAIHIRRATRRTVIGEMGFFRNVERSVSICAEEPLTLYSLTRDAMTELEEEMPDLHAGILAFIVRVLCDRLEMANHEISALR